MHAHSYTEILCIRCVCIIYILILLKHLLECWEIKIFISCLSSSFVVETKVFNTVVGVVMGYIISELPVTKRSVRGFVFVFMVGQPWNLRS